MTTPQHDVDAWREILHRLETDVARSEVVLDRLKLLAQAMGLKKCEVVLAAHSA